MGRANRTGFLQECDSSSTEQYKENDLAGNRLKIQFSIAYDAYLEICQRVDRMIDIALGFNTPKSCILCSCPACFYTLKDEPDFQFSCLISIDGNNSLKQFGPEIMKHKEQLDSCSLPSDQ
jgi:hypothetical protein